MDCAMEQNVGMVSEMLEAPPRGLRAGERFLGRGQQDPPHQLQGLEELFKLP